MSLLRKLFAKKALDGLLQISDRVYVLNCCLSTEILREKQHRENLTTIMIQLKNFYSDASFMVLNFMQNQTRKKSLEIFSHFGVSVTDYPLNYQKCPLLPLDSILHILKSSQKWLSFDKTSNNILLLHCENNSWPLVAFLLSSFLVYNKEANCENKTLEMVYRRVSKETLQLNLALNPQPSHLRYLHYVDKLRGLSDFRESHVILECVILRSIPNFDGERGCRPLLRIHGLDPLLLGDANCKRRIKYYKQGENNVVIKLNADCHIQGDVVVECVHVAKEDSSAEEIMFSFMFNTRFLQSNMVTFTRDELDIASNGKDTFQEDFKIEVFVSDPILSERDNNPTQEPSTEKDEIESFSTEIPDEFFDSEEIIANDPTIPKPNPKFPLDIHVVKITSNREPEIKLELNNETKTKIDNLKDDGQSKLSDIHVIEQKICISEGEKSDRTTKKSPRKSWLPPKIPPPIKLIKNNRKLETVLDQPKQTTPKSKITIVPKRSTTPRTNVESKVAKLIYGDKNILDKPLKTFRSSSTPPRSPNFRRSISSPIMSPTHSTSSSIPFGRRSSLGTSGTGPMPPHKILPRVNTRLVETKPSMLSPRVPRVATLTANKDTEKGFNSLTRSISNLKEPNGNSTPSDPSRGLSSPRAVPRPKFGAVTSSGTKDGSKKSVSVLSHRSISAPKMNTRRMTKAGL